MDTPTIGQRVAGWLGLATRQDLRKLVNRVEAWMALTEDEVNERLAARIAAVNAELASVKASDAQKTEALALAAADKAGENERTAAAVAAALELDTAKDIDRLRGHLQALGDDLPVDVPVVETPPAGEPAEIPTTPSDVVVAPVDESALPSTDPSTGEVSGGTGGTEPGADAPPVVSEQS